MHDTTLELVYEHQATSNMYSNRIYLICVFRDEYLLLDYFVKYYKSLGVTDFLFVDNQSSDQGSEYIKTIKSVSVKLFFADSSYKEADYGTNWVNYLLDKYCKNQYCFTVDIDELFFLGDRYSSMPALIKNMELQGVNAIPSILLDMYPEKASNDYQRGSDFLSHSMYFDKYNHQYYETGRVIYDRFSHKHGGMRKRLFGVSVCIHKFPFFKYDFFPLKMAAGYHFFRDDEGIIFADNRIIISQLPVLLLHFKFIKPNIVDFFNRRIQLNQDWDNSSEYKSYAKALFSKSAITFFDDRFSVPIDCKEQLMVFFEYK